ncbi:UNKNOWN [Stylonychia lemnae]|uniref:Uncharacterized protein n=1 Tax=Stylonychia lemnae TaxID=5949 RepID=A0A078AWV2_STYLE|nr:UNKNOWN [Stylonychia lemnae]|eukprot:CDW86910.1 UNKNOWN [Stylonychia lemnae]
MNQLNENSEFYNDFPLLNVEDLSSYQQEQNHFHGDSFFQDESTNVDLDFQNFSGSQNSQQFFTGKIVNQNQRDYMVNYNQEQRNETFKPEKFFSEFSVIIEETPQTPSLNEKVDRAYRETTEDKPYYCNQMQDSDSCMSGFSLLMSQNNPQVPFNTQISIPDRFKSSQQTHVTCLQSKGINNNNNEIPLQSQTCYTLYQQQQSQGQSQGLSQVLTQMFDEKAEMNQDYIQKPYQNVFSNQINIVQSKSKRIYE